MAKLIVRGGRAKGFLIEQLEGAVVLLDCYDMKAPNLPVQPRSLSPTL